MFALVAIHSLYTGLPHVLVTTEPQATTKTMVVKDIMGSVNALMVSVLQH